MHLVTTFYNSKKMSNVSNVNICKYIYRNVHIRVSASKQWMETHKVTHIHTSACERGSKHKHILFVHLSSYKFHWFDCGHSWAPSLVERIALWRIICDYYRSFLPKLPRKRTQFGTLRLGSKLHTTESILCEFIPTYVYRIAQ